MAPQNTIRFSKRLHHVTSSPTRPSPAASSVSGFILSELALFRHFFLSLRIPTGGVLPHIFHDYPLGDDQCRSAWLYDDLHSFMRGILMTRGASWGLSIYSTAASLAPDDAEIAFNLAAVLEACQ